MAHDLARVEQAMIKLDETVKEFTLAKAPEVGHSFVECLRKAAIVRKLEELLSDEVMVLAIIPLKDKSFGFRTDEEARIKKGWQPYSIPQLRNVMIDAIMRGLRPTNNEINVIATNLYAAKNGCKRLVKELPNVSDLVIHPRTPKMVQGGALVEMSAEFKLNGKPMKLDRLDKEAFAIRLVGDQGADAALGKAERKMNAYILETVTGTEWSESDDLDESSLKSANAIDVDISKELPAPAPQQPVSRADEVKQAMNKAAVEKAKVASKKGSSVTPPPAPTAGAPATASGPSAVMTPTTVVGATEPIRKSEPTASVGPAVTPPPGKVPRVHGFINGKKFYHDKDGKQTTDINQCADWKDAAPATAEPAKPEPAKESPKPEPAKAVEPAKQDPVKEADQGTGEIHTMTCKLAHVGQNKYKPDQRLGFPVKDEHATQYLTFNRELAVKTKKFQDLGKRVVLSYLDSGPIFSAYGKYELISCEEAPAETEPTQDLAPNDEDLEIPEDSPGQAIENLM